MPLISNRLLFLAPRRRLPRTESFEESTLDLNPEAAHGAIVQADALVEDIDEVIALEESPGALEESPGAIALDDALGSGWRQLEGYPRIVTLPSVSVVIPTLNEEANIGWVLQRMPHWVEEVIVVDGGSKDRTIEVAKALRSLGHTVHELDPRDELDLRRHIERCERCNSIIETLLAAKAAVASTAEVRPVPHSLRKHVSELVSERPRKRWLRRLVIPSLAAVMAVLVISISHLTRGNNSNSCAIILGKTPRVSSPIRCATPGGPRGNCPTSRRRRSSSYPIWKKMGPSRWTTRRLVTESLIRSKNNARIETRSSRSCVK